MLVSHRYRFIYVKTKKSAGSSVELAFEPAARPAGWVSPAGGPAFPTEEIVSEAGIVGARGPEAKAGARYWDHMPAAQIKRAVGPVIWQRYFKFCTIRNPWDKTVSFFHYVRPELRHAPRESVVANFRRWVHGPGRRRGLDRGIYWINDRPVMDAYVRYHRLCEDVATVAARLGVADARLPEVHTGFRKADLGYRDYYDENARRVVADVYGDEIEYFGWRFDSSEGVAGPGPAARGFGVGARLARIMRRA